MASPIASPSALLAPAGRFSSWPDQSLTALVLALTLASFTYQPNASTSQPAFFIAAAPYLYDGSVCALLSLICPNANKITAFSAAAIAAETKSPEYRGRRSVQFILNKISQMNSTEV